MRRLFRWIDRRVNRRLDHVLEPVIDTITASRLRAEVDKRRTH